uniref:Ubiquitin family domain containing 1 n=1 Tax=Hucho hucho TaxID=62062 RepID=A0A4W5NH48_9TELE
MTLTWLCLADNYCGVKNSQLNYAFNPFIGSEEVMETETTLKEPQPLCENVGEGNAEVSETVSRTDNAGESSSTQDPTVSNGDDSDEGKEMVDLKIIWNKNKYDLKIPLDGTGAKLKERIHSLTGLPPAMQKVMYKGLLPEDKTLREIKVTNGAKIMVVGSTINDVLAVNTPKEVIQQEVKAEENKKEPLCRQKQHRKVLDKGKPEDIMPSVKGTKERLPTVPLAGMYNKSGGKVRLTFKLEQDQLWIGTKERTEKIPMGSIKHVVTEPIEGHEDYHMMAFQLGPTEASQYWVYWVPIQFVDAIKDTVLGKWQYF